MSLSFKHDAEKGYVQVEVTADYALDLACREFVEILETVDRLGATKVLVDLRGVRGTPTAIEHYRYGEAMATELMRHSARRKCNPKFAYVVQEPLRDKSDLPMTVATNRGVFMKTVATVEDGLKWLGVEPSGPT